MAIGEVEIRPMCAADLPAVAALAIENDSVWTAADYLALDTFVAIVDGEVLVGFA